MALRELGPKKFYELTGVSPSERRAWEGQRRHLGLFFTAGGQDKLLALVSEEEVLAACRLISVRGGRRDIRDLSYKDKGSLLSVVQELAKESEKLTASEHRDWVVDDLVDLGWEIKRVAVELTWKEHPGGEPNPEVIISRVGPEAQEVLREIQRRSWGFFVPPDWTRHVVLLAKLRGVPVGSVYLNHEIKHIDFGVHVKREFWGKGVGTALLWAAFMELGRGMRTTRLLGRNKKQDERALGFYRHAGAKVSRVWRLLAPGPQGKPPPPSGPH